MMHKRMGYEYSIIKIASKKGEAGTWGGGLCRRAIPPRYECRGFPRNRMTKKTTDYSPEVIEAAKRVGQLPRPEVGGACEM